MLETSAMPSISFLICAFQYNPNVYHWKQSLIFMQIGKNSLGPGGQIYLSLLDCLSVHWWQSVKGGRRPLAKLLSGWQQCAAICHASPKENLWQLCSVTRDFLFPCCFLFHCPLDGKRFRSSGKALSCTYLLDEKHFALRLLPAALPGRRLILLEYVC